MQAIKDKISEMSAIKKAKEEARAEEKAEKEIAKAQGDIAHEMRLAKEAEATMTHHVAKAGSIAKAGEQLANEHLSKTSSGSDAAAGAGGGGSSPYNAGDNPHSTNMNPPSYHKMS